jgi:hemolysin activation/secretion protein
VRRTGFHGGRTTLAVGVALTAAFAGARGVQAQALERNLPPQPQAAPAQIAPPPAPPSDQDATPIGPDLRAIVLIGPAEAAHAGPIEGIDARAARRLSPRRATASLQVFLGRPLSRRLIARVQAAIAQDYRRAGYPFVSVSTPAQELTDGVLQVRVIEFHFGQVTVKGAKRTPAAYLKSRIRAQPGSPIASEDLSEDLDALNRYPFRRVDAAFTPGAELGQSDVILNVTETKPWSAYAGYANSGSPSTGWDRYLVGGQIGGLLGRDSLVSDQFTASADALFDKSRLFNGASHPRYISDAISLVAPVNPRGQIEASFDWVATSEVTNQVQNGVSTPFTLRQTTFEGRIGYRFALSNLGSFLSGWGDARFGVEAKHQESETLFGGARAADLSVEVYQAYLGYSKSETDALGHADLDLVAHISPGYLGAANGKVQALLFSQGRVDDVRYAYLGLTYNRATTLPLGLGLTTQLIAQYSPRPLQGTEQMGIGGQSLVRGYVLDDGAYDQAVVLRNELRGPAVRLGPAGVADLLSPYLFVDAGSGQDQKTRHTVSAASAGLGADYQLAGHISVGLDAAYALNHAVETRAGDWRLETRATLTF